MFSLMPRKSNRVFPITTRVVKNTRWIHRDELKVGMYVRELDVAWEDTNFMFQGFVVDNVTVLRDVQAVSEWVYIESQKLAQVPTQSVHRLCGATRG